MIFKIPPKPDLSVRTEVEQAILSTSPNCCCQVELHLLAESKSVLYSLNSDGNRKTEGGDEFYIRYEEYTPIGGDDKGVIDDGNENDLGKEVITQAVALITDQCDGSYELDFSTTPMNPLLPARKSENSDKSYDLNDDDDNGNEEEIVRTITVYFEYTDSMGFLSPPSKHDWLNGGYSHTKYKIRLPRRSHRPFIRAFLPPTPSVNLSKFDQVFAFGDSTFCQFFRQRPNKKGKYYFQPNLRIIGEKVRTGLNSETVDTLVELIRDDDIEKELSNDCDNTKKALIVGSCLWDILSADDTLQGSTFIDHYNACKDYICRLRKRYPELTIVWKSPMAVHIHWVDLQRVVEHDRATATLFGINRIKYMSASRSLFLYKLQRKLMEELQVPMIDLYEATYLSADLLYPSDGRHYKPDLNRKMLSWFYPTSSLHMGTNKDEQKRAYFRHVV
uniref:Uncharacterized protein n=1 Tax=Pseudo-nitzschia australis TaxID=44445 RepID=A0A7S4EQL6_9STRA|mmetsp:Transcript_9170/g.19862  ORF Transcript_9170/g.19862 Transcript_9170/m.19862 type:complete len:446 (+) Transcript_9170:108-1445(+)|eukprot:CAMPEP_0168168506 /NCGR_PEP_ID=MMETSP0139_2-20121125/3129_1 /TAXON_ID=44445 /ORGANISM="Pseudo-nitzschia australis, Strain 10249 10 AB" /LENGTH=445 /DNA_ID=CAMNT_0008085839 /DNA_START=37 /DNA_END=1374 /DNA_ORIENTATION=-